MRSVSHASPVCLPRIACCASPKTPFPPSHLLTFSPFLAPHPALPHQQACLCSCDCNIALIAAATSPLTFVYTTWTPPAPLAFSSQATPTCISHSSTTMDWRIEVCAAIRVRNAGDRLFTLFHRSERRERMCKLKRRLPEFQILMAIFEINVR